MRSLILCLVAVGILLHVLFTAWVAHRSAPAANRRSVSAPARLAPPSPPARLAPSSSSFPPVCAPFKCSCQTMSNMYGTSHISHDFGTAPEDARRWWVNHSCRTAPTSCLLYMNSSRTATDICDFLAHCEATFGDHARPPLDATTSMGCIALPFGNAVGSFYHKRLVAGLAGIDDIRWKACSHDREVDLFRYFLHFDPASPNPEASGERVKTICRFKAGFGYPWENMFWPASLVVPSMLHDFQAAAAAWRDAHPQVDILEDDAVVHFRAMDVFSPRQRSYGFGPWWRIFDALRDMVPKNRRLVSIGVVTNVPREVDDWIGPHYHGGNVDGHKIKDMPYVNQSVALLNVFVRALEREFPASRVRVRTGKDETVAASVSRLVLAPVLACSGPGTMCTFAAMGQAGRRALVFHSSEITPWALGLSSDVATVVDLPILSGADIARLKLDAEGVARVLLQRDDDYCRLACTGQNKFKRRRWEEVAAEHGMAYPTWARNMRTKEEEEEPG